MFQPKVRMKYEQRVKNSQVYLSIPVMAISMCDGGGEDEFTQVMINVIMI